MRISALFGTAACLAAVTAAAQDRPPIMQPSRDVMVEYHVSGVAMGPHRSDTVRMYFTDHGSKLRIEPVGQGDYSIMDRSARHMIIVMGAAHAYLEMPYDPTRIMPFNDPNVSLVRQGSATVAGLSCTVYLAKRQDHVGHVCLTDDGLLLRAKGDNPNDPEGSLEATKVSYGSQPAALFAPPPDYQKMDVARMGRPPAQH
jgi:hypothetical protein